MKGGNDPVKRIMSGKMSRRKLLAALGAAGTAAVTGAAWIDAVGTVV
ncbi:twin-arginine translocation signal domain-containing protein [Paenibacillus mesophilus]|nr:twin-arginine translocation signal domain-containing protein [Paenibacillus mesophilus]TMV52221.1 twin-arginine translocation signal domain-containing protein [Paenibacillus mesophilus]